MKNLLRSAACALVALASICAAAQDKPAWAEKGTRTINADRSNDSYTVVAFDTHNADKTFLESKRFEPLFMYVRENFSAQPEGLAVDSVQEDGVTTYIIAYTDKDKGTRHTLQARRIDQYSEYDDFESNDYEWYLYQLYAVGRPDETPRFDEFELTRAYNAKATAMSIVPGWGQIYKGQTAKGCVIIGLEAVSVAGIIIGEHKRSRMMDDAAKHPEVYDSWVGKAHSWRNVRNVSIGVAVATYVYNLIDAATSKGARRVKVHKRAGEGLSFAPTMWNDGAGMTFSYSF
ncbi:MAG: hypothetical protein K2L76_07730 [Muribaculaceae bacterium]|nr:hypothetical protein [Muribaculaceae bacterium]